MARVRDTKHVNPQQAERDRLVGTPINAHERVAGFSQQIEAIEEQLKQIGVDRAAYAAKLRAAVDQLRDRWYDLGFEDDTVVQYGRMGHCVVRVAGQLYVRKLVEA